MTPDQLRVAHHAVETLDFIERLKASPKPYEGTALTLKTNRVCSPERRLSEAERVVVLEALEAFSRKTLAAHGIQA